MSVNAYTQLIQDPLAKREGLPVRFNLSDWLTRIPSRGYLRFLVAAFVALSSADFVLTRLLLQGSAGEIYESNPLADTVLMHSGWFGLALFKTALVGLAAGVILYIAPRKPKSAYQLARFACLVTSGVVAYSICLGFLFV
jgi:hypothetical protein